MDEEKKSGRIFRRDFMKAAGLGTLAARIGGKIRIVHG